MRNLRRLTSALALASLIASPALAQRTPTLVKDIDPGFTSSIPQGKVVVVGGLYYFTSSVFEFGIELWRSDGTDAGTFLVKDIHAGEQNGVDVLSLFAFDDALYFAGDEEATGSELWKSDGSEAGTNLVVDINQALRATDSSAPQAFYTAGGRLFFEAGDPLSSFGSGLYVSDGTAEGTLRLIDAERIGPEDWDCAAVGARLFCSLQTENAAGTRELFVTDGTIDGTELVAPATLASLPQGLTAVGDSVFFWASDDAHGLELWKSDGTEAGTVLVKDCAPGEENSIGSTGFLGLYTAYDGGFLFSASNGDGSFMWKSDGTEAGTVPVGDNVDGVLSFAWLTSRGPDVFFQGGEADHGRELWITDGTQAGTRLVKDINPGRDDALDGDDEFSLIGDTLYFVADDGTHGLQVWRSDGTEEGTVRLTGFTTTFERYLRPRHIRGLGDKILFFADEGAPGAKLWSLDQDAPAFEEAGGSGGTGGSGGGGAAGSGPVAGEAGTEAGGSAGTGSNEAGETGSGATAGVPAGGRGGSSASGGSPSNGGAGASSTAGTLNATGGGGSPGAAGSGGDDDDRTEQESGCGCRTAGSGSQPFTLALTLSALLVLLGRRRHR
jgi:MYXO-CTERM domain-containing protein